MLKNKLHINWLCLTQVLYCRASIAATNYISAISFMGITLCLSLIYSKFYPLFSPALFKKFTLYSFLFSYHYLLFSFCPFSFIASGINIQRNTDLMHIFCSYCVNFSNACIYIPYCLKLRPVSYKRWVSISDLGIACYNIINHIAIVLHESLATIKIHC